MGIDSRLKIMLGIGLFMVVLWIIYLFILQMFDPFDLKTAQKRRYDAHKEFTVAQRGNIYDHRGTLLVSSLNLHQIDIDLNRLRAIARRNDKPVSHYFDIVAEVISENSHLNKSDVYRRMANARGSTVVISERINEDQLFRIREGLREQRLHVMVSAFNSTRRVYTRGPLAARLLGVTRGVTDERNRFNRYTFRLEGLNGIERAFDRDLSGDYGWRKILFDARQRIIPVPNNTVKPALQGSDIYLTIDADIQEILENNLRRGLTQFRAKNAIGLIMNPNNGNIVAMAGISENDRRVNENQLRSLQNMPIQFLFEPGSTIKPFVSLLALERNLVRDTDIIDCRPWQTRGRRIRDTSDLGRITFREVITLSSNVGVARVADKIGANDLYRHYLNLGFGTFTGVDLPEESSGLFRKVSDWSNFTLHSISFGQEMSVTALQLANAFSALANGGYLLRPNIIDRKVDSNGRVYYQAQRRVMNTVSNDKNAVALNNNILVDAVESGTGAGTRFRNVRVAGKTGTSEKAVGGRYSRTQFTSSFAGFFPYENPQYVMVIIYDEPEFRFRFGSVSAVPTFRSVVEEMLTLPDCRIIPDLRMANQELITMPNLIGMRITEARRVLTGANINFQVFNESRDAYVVHQLPLPGVQFGSRNKISIYCGTERRINNQQTEFNEFVMPNLVGMSLRQAINVSKILRLNLSISGSGHVVSQSIPEGARITLQQVCVVVAR